MIIEKSGEQILKSQNGNLVVSGMVIKKSEAWSLRSQVNDNKSKQKGH